MARHSRKRTVHSRSGAQQSQDNAQAVSLFNDAGGHWAALRNIQKIHNLIPKPENGKEKTTQKENL